MQNSSQDSSGIHFTCNYNRFKDSFLSSPVETDRANFLELMEAVNVDCFIPKLASATTNNIASFQAPVDLIEQVLAYHPGCQRMQEAHQFTEMVEDNAKLVTTFEACSTAKSNRNESIQTCFSEEVLVSTQGQLFAAETPTRRDVPALYNVSLFQCHGQRKSPSVRVQPSSGELLHKLDLSSMKQMFYTATALRQDMDPVRKQTSECKPPKRRNVRISKDPQTVAARHRRERISEKIRTLQRLVPGGTKMDTASMLDEAIEYVKFLKKQVQFLEMLGCAANGPPSGNFSGMISDPLLI